MKKIYLVCGAGGFIGGHLVKSLLADGHEVVCADIKPLENWFLGHDFPQYRVTMDFLGIPGLWCHAKNHAALDRMVENPLIHCFWHQRDDYTLTSKGYIWAYPQKKTSNHTVAVCLKRSTRKIKEIAGLCTDYPIWWASRLKSLKKA